ncbi:LOW QUALITY PROTEIN: SET and MYND domain containing, class 4, member 4 [Aphomia sociella]
MSIDNYYENALTKLRSDNRIIEISQKLLSLTRNDERVLYVYGILGSLGAFPPAISVSKSENVSTYYRLLGNQSYEKTNYTAIQYYNLSMLYAPLDSECYSLALSNRSAVFLSLRKYNECFQDIEQVLKIKFPVKLKSKIEKRKETCLNNLGKSKVNQNETDSEINDLLMLQGLNDDTYSCASIKLKVVYNDTMGRHVVAKEDIKVGDVLVQEEPYTLLLMKTQYLFSCGYCLSRRMNLLPCHKCCYVLYCSENCRLKAWKDYHETECSLTAMLLDMQFTKLEWLALRTVIKARNDHQSWSDLFKTIEAVDGSDIECKGHVKENDKLVYNSKYYASVHSLSSNIEKRSVSDIFQKSVTAAVFFDMLIKYTNFLDSDSIDTKMEARKCVAGMLLHHIMTVPTNMHGIQSTMQSKQGSYVEDENIASAAYAYHSLFNHSCSPNVVRVNILGSAKMVLIALRPIKKGMQIFDNYGYHHALQDFETRQSSLRFQYKFTCCCEACIDDWPLYFHMAQANILPPKLLKQKKVLLNSDVIEKLQKGDIKTARKLYKPLCELAEALEPYVPCSELADCQETLKQCLQIFGGLIPYHLNPSVQWAAKPPINDTV